MLLMFQNKREINEISGFTFAENQSFAVVKFSVTSISQLAMELIFNMAVIIVSSLITKKVTEFPHFLHLSGLLKKKTNYKNILMF